MSCLKFKSVASDNNLLAGKEYVVLVTGACSFLGQHVLRQIQRRSKHITAIRIFEYQDFIQELEYETHIPVEVMSGSLTKYEDVLLATRGVQTVFHLAITQDRRMFTDMEPVWNLNVKGTQNIIKACKENKVKILISTSAADVVIGYDDIYMGTENSTRYPSKYLFKDSDTKREAEVAVLAANGSGLKTLVIRPVTMYGELDRFFFPKMLHFALWNRCQLVCVGDVSTEAQLVYVGNVAWAVLCAERALLHRLAPCAGKAYFITDDTPVDNTFSLVKPLLERYGFFLTTWSVPEQYAKAFALLITLTLWLVYPFIYFNPVFTFELVHYWCHTYTFSNEQARQDLLYSPIYTHYAAWHRTFRFFDDRYKHAVMEFMTTQIMAKEHSCHVKRLQQLNEVKQKIESLYPDHFAKKSRQARLKAALGRHLKKIASVTQIISKFGMEK